MVAILQSLVGSRFQEDFHDVRSFKYDRHMQGS